MRGIVLYVEDEDGDRFLMKTAFAREGLAGALHVVGDGRLALDYLSGGGAYVDREAHPMPGVVLLDLNLPEIHGFDVLKWIRAHPLHSTLPVVVFTSSQRDEDRARAKLLGASDFFLKPSSVMGFQEMARRLNDRYLSG
jgi:CheY-like chemotaxis protein